MKGCSHLAGLPFRPRVFLRGRGERFNRLSFPFFFACGRMRVCKHLLSHPPNEMLFEHLIGDGVRAGESNMSKETSRHVYFLFHSFSAP